MTTLQIKVAVAVKELGSISAAAKQLGISQPNASSCIKSLEGEVGFEIFQRSKSGASLTEKGRIFLDRAKRILSEHDSIMDIRNHPDVYRLRLGTVNYYTAIEPFLRLCQAHRDDPETDFRYFSVSIEEGIRELGEYNLDVIFVPALKSQIAGVKSVCKKEHLALISICELPAAISVRSGHPAALDGRCRNITQGSDAMKDFPYAAYRNLFEDSGSTGYNDSDFVQCSYKMFVDEVDVRLRLVASTNAFSFGLIPSKGVNERYNIVSFPVPGITLELFCITREDDQDKREIQEYISLLRKELELTPEAMQADGTASDI